MPAPSLDYTPITLRNLGVPVSLYTLDADGKPQFTAEGAPITEAVYLKITTNVLADIELAWESLEGWEAALEAKPFQTLRVTLGLVLECDARTAAARVPDASMPDIISGLLVAMALSQGMDPTSAGETLKKAKASLALAQDTAMARLGETLTFTQAPDSDEPSDASTDAVLPTLSVLPPIDHEAETFTPV